MAAVQQKEVKPTPGLWHTLLSCKTIVADRHLRNTHSIPESQLAAVPSPTLRRVSSVARPHQPGVFNW